MIAFRTIYLRKENMRCPYDLLVFWQVTQADVLSHCTCQRTLPPLDF
jgi:hypothetical protein